MAGGSFLSILRLGLFIIAVWTTGRIARQAGISTILPEILTGVLLGPQILSLVPETYTVCQAKIQYPCEDSSYMADYTETHAGECDSWSTENFVSEDACFLNHCKDHQLHECDANPNVFTLMGHFGVSLMIFESGMHFHFPILPKVGPKASAIAVLGTVLPIIAGILLSSAYGYAVLPQGLTVGVAMAPTSVGIALKLLMETKQIDQLFGQTIIAAAFLDDILSLIAFGVLFDIGKSGEISLQSVLVKPLLAVGFIGIGGYLAAKVFPHRVPLLLEWVETKVKPTVEGGFGSKETIHLILMVLLLVVYSVITAIAMGGSHLWGCFVAGMSFSGVKQSVFLWTRQSKRVTAWMMRFFFAGTVGFAIPVSTMFTFPAFWRGTILGIVGCIVTKLLSGCWVGEEKWVIGWAMVGRAEFAYLIAAMALTMRMIDDMLYSILMWALVYATITAPAGFQRALHVHVHLLEDKADDNKDDKIEGGASMLAKGADTPMGGTIAPGVSFLELFNRRGTIMKSPTAIRMRIIFAKKPSKHLESLFNETTFKFAKMSAYRDLRTIHTTYAIRCAEPLRYGHLRVLRKEIFRLIGGGPGYKNILEIQYLPAEASTLETGMLKFSIIADSDPTDEDVPNSSLGLIFQALRDANFYVLQMNFKNTGVKTHTELVCYPLPIGETPKDPASPTAMLSSAAVDSQIMQAKAECMGNKSSYFMDNAICSENVRDVLIAEGPKIRNQLYAKLHNRNPSIDEQFLIFDTDPLKNSLYLPCDHMYKAGSDTTNFNRSKMIYLEISYPKETELPENSVVVKYKGEEDPMMNVKKTSSKQQIGGTNIMTTTGCGLQVGDAEVWVRTIPDMLCALQRAGLTVLHSKIDHMILIDNPTAMFIVQPNNTGLNLKNANMDKENKGASPKDIKIEGECVSPVSAAAGNDQTSDLEYWAKMVRDIAHEHLITRKDIADRVQEGFKVSVFTIDKENCSKECSFPHLEYYVNEQRNSAVPPTRKLDDLHQIFMELANGRDASASTGQSSNSTGVVVHTN